MTWGLLNSTLFKMCIFINFQYVLLHDLKKQNLFIHVVLINPILSMIDSLSELFGIEKTTKSLIYTPYCDIELFYDLGCHLRRSVIAVISTLLRGEACVHKTSLIPPLFIVVPVPT